MRFTELANKEIISLNDGARLGPIGDADLAFDEATGRILTILVPPRSRFARAGQMREVPWSAVRRVGPEVIIIDMVDMDMHPRRQE